MLPSASVLAYRREERVHKKFSPATTTGPHGDARYARVPRPLSGLKCDYVPELHLRLASPPQSLHYRLRLYVAHTRHTGTYSTLMALVSALLGGVPQASPFCTTGPKALDDAGSAEPRKVL